MAGRAAAIYQSEIWRHHTNPMKFEQLILSKIIKVVGTRCPYKDQNGTKIAPKSISVAVSSLTLPSLNRGPISTCRGGVQVGEERKGQRKRKGVREGREGDERKGKGRDRE